MSKHQYEYEMDLTLLDQYDENTLIELRVRVNFEYTPGTPASGITGPPENYDPGSEDEVVVLDNTIRIYDAGIPAMTAQPLELPHWLRMVIVTKLEGHEERMAEQAQDD